MLWFGHLWSGEVREWGKGLGVIYAVKNVSGWWLDVEEEETTASNDWIDCNFN